MDGRRGGAKRSARRRYKADTATARVMCRMPGSCRDWTREEPGLFYGAEASVDDHECRRSAYKHTDDPPGWRPRVDTV